MTAAELYQKYRLMPNLQLHMYRVAGVATEICDHIQPQFQAELQRNEVLAACLLHDVGNIIKFDLQKFPQFLEPEGLEYWQQVQNEFFANYGFDEHKATLRIAQEIGVNPQVVELIKAIGFAQVHDHGEEVTVNHQICAYADVRVTPFGVVSLEERLQDLEERYGDKYPEPEQLEQRRIFATKMHEIEVAIFQRTTITPADVTEEKVKVHFPILQQFQLAE